MNTVHTRVPAFLGHVQIADSSRPRRRRWRYVVVCTVGRRAARTCRTCARQSILHQTEPGECVGAHASAHLFAAAAGQPAAHSMLATARRTAPASAVGIAWPAAAAAASAGCIRPSAGRIPLAACRPSAAHTRAAPPIAAADISDLASSCLRASWAAASPVSSQEQTPLPSRCSHMQAGSSRQHRARRLRRSGHVQARCLGPTHRFCCCSTSRWISCTAISTWPNNTVRH